MASTYVNDLRLNELGTGDASGTWGTITNLNLELIGEGLSYGTQDCFTTDADDITTVADGASDPARAMYFKVTSSATLTATRTLTIAPNTVSRLQFIENATTGGQSINISQGSGANVSIPTGATKAVYLDGGGATAAVTDAFANLSAGTITASLTGNVTGNVTGDVTGNVTGDLTGNVTGNVTGNADTATTLETARTIAGQSFDGSANITIASTDLSDSGSIDATTLDSLDSTQFLRSDAADSKTSGDLTFSDDVKAVFGAGSDLQIYHDSATGHSHITESGTGELLITGTDIYLKSSGGENYIYCDNDGRVDIYHNNLVKLTTANDGISVTGNVQSSSGAYEGASDQDKIVVGASQIDFYIDNSNEFRMESDGDFHADGDVIAFSTTISDERLKTDIEKIENATDKVSQLNGYTFTYKADGKKSAGVIAQEVEKVLPSAVSEKELPLKTDDGVAYKTVQYDQIIGLLIESIKELKQEINELKGA
jgi:hypothetical protein